MLYLLVLKLCATALFLLPALAATLAKRVDQISCYQSAGQANRQDCATAAGKLIIRNSNCHNRITVPEGFAYKLHETYGNCCVAMIRTGSGAKAYSEDYLLASFSEEIEQCVSGETDLDNGALRITSLGPGYGQDYCNWNKRDLEQSDLQNMNRTLENRSGIEACQRQIGPIVAQGAGWIVSYATTGSGRGSTGALSGTQIASYVDDVLWEVQFKVAIRSHAYLRVFQEIDGKGYEMWLTPFGTMAGASWDAVQSALGGSDAMYAALIAATRHAINTGLRTTSYNIGGAPEQKLLKVFFTKMLYLW